jgi:hypothetical protein
MQVILITDNDINEVIAVYTLKKFIQEANKEYWKANDFNGTREYFNLNSLGIAINWYINTSDNLSLDIMEVETSLDDEV